MTKVTKLIAASLLGMTIASGVGTAAKANTKFTDGLYNGHNGYYMAYSYYYDSDNSHYSWARLGTDNTGNKNAPAGQTSMANTGSHASTDWDAGHSN